jgi:membrane associated rhomboid family serine protease
MELLATRDPWWTTQCEAALLSQGIRSRWLPLPQPQPGVAGALVLDVHDSDVERAQSVLSEQLGDELAKAPAATASAAGGVGASGAVGATGWTPLLLQPDFAFGLCLSLLLLAFYWVTGGFAHAGATFERGVMVMDALHRGEWWRLVTAATLHANLEHALGNASFVLVLAWAASERFGPGVTLLVWLVTAAGGFVVSVWFSDAAVVTVGASGGLFGLLGAAGGNGWRGRRDIPFAWRERMRVGGAAALLLAFTAFSREANIPAHLGGFVVGTLCGLAVPVGRRPSPVAQVACGATAAAAIVLAWGRA